MGKRALSVEDIMRRKRNIVQFEGPWKDSIGNPELKGTWFVWGPSGSGKTSFVMQLCKYLTRFERVFYNSLEEGDSVTIREALVRVNMHQVRRKFLFLDKEHLEEVKERLRTHKAPRVVVIDSVQFLQVNYREYYELTLEFPHVLFIVISHADGAKPSGRTAAKIQYLADVKIQVEGFVARVTSRFGGGEPFIINEALSKKFHSANSTEA